MKTVPPQRLHRGHSSRNLSKETQPSGSPGKQRVGASPCGENTDGNESWEKSQAPFTQDHQLLNEMKEAAEGKAPFEHLRTWSYGLYHAASESQGECAEAASQDTHLVKEWRASSRLTPLHRAAPSMPLGLQLAAPLLWAFSHCLRWTRSERDAKRRSQTLSSTQGDRIITQLRQGWLPSWILKTTNGVSGKAWD